MLDAYNMLKEKYEKLTALRHSEPETLYYKYKTFVETKIQGT